MTIAREYRMVAQPDAADELLAALTALASALQDLPGFEGAELMQDQAAPGRFVFLEKWASVQAHADSGARLPKEALSRVMGLLGDKPQVATYEVVRSA